MSIFRDTFKQGVQNQLTIRQKSIAERTPAAIQYYNARNAWIRLSSAVNVGGKADLAKQYILQGGVLYQNNLRAGVGVGDEAYSLNSPGGRANRLGIRPMPGITGMDIQSKGSYGSLRSITVNFIAWDLRQLEDLELLYMRPGYTALVEWGWAPYLNNDGTLSSANTIPFYDIVNKTPSQNQIYMDLFKNSSETGNYDAMYGKIQNYSWKARPDGGYDCTTTIISIGEVIDSLKVNYCSVKNIEKEGGLIAPRAGISVTNEISGSYSQNVVAGLCNELYTIINKKAVDNQIYVLTEGNDKYTFFKFPVSVSDSTSTKTSITKSGKQIYITLESFVTIMNKFVLLYAVDSNNRPQPYVELSVNSSTITSNGSPLLCLGNQIQLSVDPSICLIANQNWEDPAANLGISDVNNEALKIFVQAANANNKGYFFKKEGSNSYNDLQYGIIGNIFINLDYIYSIITDDNTASQDKKEKNDISLYTFVKTLMSGINSVIGNIANFDVHVDPTDGNIARIIDVNYVDTATREEAYNKAFTFEMQSTGPVSGSIIRNYSFESSIFPEQSATIAIASQVEGGALGSGDNTMVDFYQNLTDRIMPKKAAPTSNVKTPASDNIESTIQTLMDNLKTLLEYISELNKGIFSGGDFDASKASSYANALKDIINYLSNVVKSNNNNRGIIPTKLSFEIDGIGGIVIGNMFRIPNEILPRGYKGDGAGPAKIGFLVLRLGHSIQSNDWITKVDSQFVILDEPRGQNISAANITSLLKTVSKGKSPKDIASEVKILTTLPGPPASDIPKNVTVDRVIAAMQKKGYTFYSNTTFGKNKLNVVGVRETNKAIGSTVTNYFTDYIVMFYYDDTGKRPERIGWLTTAPGLTYEAKQFGGADSKGKRTIMMKEGQYLNTYRKGLHNGTPALVQAGVMQYYRDPILVNAAGGVQYDSTDTVSSSALGTNIHPSGDYGATDPRKKIDNWSAGCQVIKSYGDYVWMMQAVANQITKTNLKSFNYTLLSISDL